MGKETNKQVKEQVKKLKDDEREKGVQSKDTINVVRESIPVIIESLTASGKTEAIEKIPYLNDLLLEYEISQQGWDNALEEKRKVEEEYVKKCAEFTNTTSKLINDLGTVKGLSNINLFAEEEETREEKIERANRMLAKRRY